jgi:NADH-quinone oxidoreductase subunit H
VIPFDSEVTIFGYKLSLVVADVNIGLLYIVATTSISVYGIILAGYASNSKFPLLAGLRASAQLISYEVAVTMMLVSMVVTAGTLSMVGIVEAQLHAGVWYAFIQPVAFVILFIGGLAETNRAPFDLPEAEQELTGGFHTEYSGMRFALFFLAEYVNMVTVAAVATSLYLGGWLGPFLPDWLQWIYFLIKVFLILFFYVWMRWTLPRYRYDQLMEFGWKWLLPVSVVNLLATAVLVLWIG